MKIKREWEKAYEAKLPSDARQRILAAARAKMGEQENASFLSRIWLPAFGGAALAAAGVALLLLRAPAPTGPVDLASDGLAFRYPPAMVRDAEMLYDLRVIRNRAILEKIEKRKWPKKKS